MTRSIAHLFFEACEKFDKPDAVLVKENGAYRPYSHKFFRQRVSNLGRGLISIGLQENEHVAVLAETRFEWAIADLGIIGAGCVDVPVYPTLAADQIAWILNNADAVGVIASSREQVDKIMQIKDQVTSLRFVVMMEEDAPEGVLTMRALEAKGAMEDNEGEFVRRWQGCEPDDLLTLIYTSGTTGNPKGVELTHANLLANVKSCESLMPCTSEDIHLSHLPLSHVLERMGGYYNMIHHGVTIAYAEDMKTVADNIREVKPTILVSVPRLFEKIYAKVMISAESGSFIKKGLFGWALGVGRKATPYFNKEEKPSGFLGRKWALADSLVFSKVKEKTGGRLKYMVSGGAPLAKEIADFFVGMGLSMVEGYGLTETSPVLTLNPLAHNKPGTVGPPLPEVEIRIAEDGEILARGPNLMRGYYKNPTATEEAIQDGWFHTGDIGRLDEDGYLQITDRKKDLLVTSGGKNIAPQPLENALKLSPLIEQAVILGDKRNFIAALIVPPWETIDEWCTRHGWPATIEACINHEGFRKALHEEVSRCMQSFAHFERVKKFEIIPSPFLVETGELTPSMKVKRKVVNDKYADVIEGIYQK